MYNTRPGLLIGFHGCDKTLQQQMLSNPSTTYVSDKPYDWLGHGMYFWENNYARALQWAKEKEKRGTISEAAVIGAVLDLGYCCDLLDKKFIETIAVFYQLMEKDHRRIGKRLPENKDAPDDPYNDKLIRFLDCSTIEFMHKQIKDKAKADMSISGYTKYKIFDSLRGVFIEGGPAYTGAGFRSNSHIQICIRNPNSIKGFFLPREEIDFFQEMIVG